MAGPPLALWRVAGRGILLARPSQLETEADPCAGHPVTAVTASHPRLPLRLHFNDAVDYGKNFLLLLRQVWVQNLSDRPLEPRLFFHTDINALENEIGDTVFFDPRNACLAHYKGPRYFMMSCATEAAGRG